MQARTPRNCFDLVYLLQIQKKKDQRNPNLGTFLSNASTSKTKHCYENLAHLSIPITKVRFLKN